MKKVALSVLLFLLMILSSAYASGGLIGGSLEPTSVNLRKVEPGEAQVGANSDSLYSIEEAAAYLRDGLRNHQSVIYVTYAGPWYKKDVVATCDYIFEKAVEHTGKPNEGDYLRWQNAGYSITGEYAEQIIKAEYHPSYLDPENEESAVNAEVIKIKNDLQLSSLPTDFEKITAIYDYICKNVRYDSVSSGTRKHSAPAAFLDHYAVCQGYALMFYRLSLECGIDCRIITSIDHAWNIVQINGKYYNIDTTWDEGYTYHDYFMKSMNDFTDHPREDEYKTSAFNISYPMGAKSLYYDPENPSIFKLPTSMKSISASSFMGTDPEIIVIPSSVNTIGKNAFSGNTDIKYIVIPASVMSIDQTAFDDCPDVRLIVYPQSFGFYYATSLSSFKYTYSIVTSDM